MHLKTDRELPV